MNRIRKNYPLIPKIDPESGYFGNQTLSAVKKFQSIFSLDVDGIVGKATWYKISYIYVAVSKLASLDYEVSNKAILKVGSRGSNVLDLQKDLNMIRRRYPSIIYLSEDGIFGQNTKKAVMEFQRLTGLSVDGIVGNQTYKMIDKVLLGV